MKILLIEDEPEGVARLKEELTDVPVEFLIAEDADTALEILTQGPFDLAVCDLKIPESRLVPQPHTAHGLRAFDNIRARFPGVPVIIYSGFGSSAFGELGDRLSAAPQHDLFGEGATDHVIHRSKGDPEKLIDEIREFAAQLSRLDEIEITPGPSREYLTYYDRRLLRIYARQQQCSLVHVERLAGGRSGAVTVKLACESIDGPAGGAIVAKLNTYDEVQGERQRYKRYIGGLGATTFTPLMETLVAGAGDRAALFYALAQGFDTSLFDLLAQSDVDAATVVANLFEAVSAWREGAKSRAVELALIRRALLSDERVHDLPESSKALFDNVSNHQHVNVRWGTSHGDLHGGNVLVKDREIPVLIDYGRLGEMTASLDPITLELSAILHPDSPVDLNGWPNPDQAERWDDLDFYLDKCPTPAFVGACRTWTDAVARAPREMDATVLAYALRQLRFHEDIDPALPTALARGAVRRLQES
jgi:CheY-like chemotaxis protein